MSVGWGLHYDFQSNQFVTSYLPPISTSRLLPPCDGGYIEIDGECYYQSDLDVLQQFIDNSQGGSNPPPSDLSPIELGNQIWEEGRLSEICFTSFR